MISNTNVGGEAFSCRDQTSTWLWVYFQFIWWFSSLYLITPSLLLCVTGRFIWLIYQCYLERAPDSLEWTSPPTATLFEIRFRQLKTFLNYEGKLIVFYVLSALSFELIKGGSIRWMLLARWIIEASFIPAMVFGAMFQSYLVPGSEYLLDNDPRLYYVAIYPSKAILFFIMRYIEAYPSSAINESQVRIFYRFCNLSESN
jgi:hypothetical protein